MTKAFFQWDAGTLTTLASLRVSTNSSRWVSASLESSGACLQVCHQQKVLSTAFVSSICSWLYFCWAEAVKCLLMGEKKGLTTASWIIRNGEHKHCFYSSFQARWQLQFLKLYLSTVLVNIMHMAVTNITAKISIWYWKFRSGVSQRPCRTRSLILNKDSIIILHVYRHTDALMSDNSSFFNKTAFQICLILIRSLKGSCSSQRHDGDTGGGRSLTTTSRLAGMLHHLLHTA